MKTVLITGASRGIGRAVSEYFAEHGWQVVINYNKSEKDALSLADLIKQKGG
ncbi:MAG: SDR family NAD(P)-dependent oxidoreductase, partial [Clostridia bacterium]|nr:SDR family NAD(P)-dependent oxidoreductase [Clostridia bacterium]